MKFTFRRPNEEAIGHLEFYSADKRAIQLPLHHGITFIGKGLESHCEYKERDLLRGIVEQAQVLIKHNEDGTWVSDATSTNQSKLIRGRSAKSIIEQLDSNSSVLRQATYFGEGILPDGISVEDISPIPWQPLDTSRAERVWLEVSEGDVLIHFYGFMILRLL